MEMNLKGNVHIITEYSYTYTGTDSFLSERIIFSFDSAGYLNMKDWYYNDFNNKDSTHEIYTYKYDHSGNLVEDSAYQTYECNYIIRKDYYNFDSLGTLTEYRTNVNGYLWKIMYTYKYNDKKNAVEKTEKDTRNSYTLLYVYGYNEQGNITIECKYLTSDDKRYKNKFMWQRRFGYDSCRNIIYKKEYFTDSTKCIHYIYKYKFDNSRNWVKKTTYDPDSISSVTVRLIEYF